MPITLATLKSKIPSEVQNPTNAQLIKDCDDSLLSDFLDNHYPKVKEYWIEFLKTFNVASDSNKSFRELVRVNLISELNSYRIQYTDENSGLKDILESVKYFYDALIKLLIDGKFDLNTLQYLTGDDAVTFNRTTVYKCATSNGSTVLLELRSICTSIANDEDVKKALENWKLSDSQKKEAYGKFEYALKIISRKTNLQFEKGRLLMTKCRFVKTKLY